MQISKEINLNRNSFLQLCLHPGICAQLHHVILLHIKFHHARLQARKVEDVKYQIDQLLSISPDNRRIFLLLLHGQIISLAKRIRKSYNRMKRDTNFIRDVVKKDFFHLISRLNHGIRFTHFTLRLRQFPINPGHS